MFWAGWLGTIFLGLCGIFQALHCWQRGNSEGLSWFFMGLWGVGEILRLYHVTVNLPVLDMALIVGYTIDLCSLGVMVKYKLYPREPTIQERIECMKIQSNSQPKK